MMRPTQFDTQCVSNCFFTWVSLIKQTTIAKLGLGKPLAKIGSQFAREALKKTLAVCRSLSLLFFYNDPPSNKPIGQRHGKIHVPYHTLPGTAYDLANIANTIHSYWQCRRNQRGEYLVFHVFLLCPCHTHHHYTSSIYPRVNGYARFSFNLCKTERFASPCVSPVRWAILSTFV